MAQWTPSVRNTSSEGTPAIHGCSTRGTASILRLVLVTTILFAAPQASAEASTITLMWDPSSSTNVAGYVVYVGTKPGTYTKTHDVGGTLSFVLWNAVAGQQYCFAVAAYAPGPLLGAHSSEVCGYSDAPPALKNPGSQQSVVGAAVGLQLEGSDPYGQPVSYAASGLPSGLTLMQSTGFISGVPSKVGTYNVTATVTDGTLSASQQFTWSITDSLETTTVDTTPPAVTITSHASGSTVSVSNGYVTIAGTATDNVGVAGVFWSNSREGTGQATGTATWAATIPLKNGNNVITVTATDTSGNQASQSITVQW